MAVNIGPQIGLFLSTSPVWGTTGSAIDELPGHQFLSTSPVWGTTQVSARRSPPGGYFYPRPPYGGRLNVVRAQVKCLPISIHVPRMGDDMTARCLLSVPITISIHVPRMGDDKSSPA